MSTATVISETAHTSAGDGRADCFAASSICASHTPLKNALIAAVLIAAFAAVNVGAAQTATIPAGILLRIVRAEDERRWDVADLGALLADRSASVRRRAALAAGRIGDEGAINTLSVLLQKDEDEEVRAMAAFALGEIEAAAGADVLLETLRGSEAVKVRARALEALGKIAAALPKSDEARRQSIGEAIVVALNAEQKSIKPNREMVLYGLTAILRARPADAGRAAVTPFLDADDARVRADAANTLARLRAKDVNAERLRARLAGDADALVRANVARVLGAAEDKASFGGLLDRATNDPDERVRVSAIRALASLQEARAATALMKKADTLFSAYRAARAKGSAHPAEANELLEVATALGRTLPNTGDERALTFLRNLSEAEERGAPEIEIALARIAPARYLREPMPSNASPARSATQAKWQTVSAVAQGLGEMASITSAPGDANAAGFKDEAQKMLRDLADDKAGTPPLAMPDVLRAYAAFKTDDLGDMLRAKLNSSDVIVRATAAELLVELSPAPATTRALADALPRAFKDEMNDAALAILVALAKQNHAEAFNAIKTALVVPDHLVRRRAAALLKGNGQQQGVGSAAVTGEHFMTAKNPRTVYAQARARVGKRIRAIVTTDKGAFIIELLPEDAPLTVDNFVELARRRFFDGITFHRVVPNFVIQGGDPRGDGNGGPGHQIRCEINQVPYARGAVGMALSGKDTGGSQWFVTHSPQPHLDGGYTVFGRVVAGMETVDRIARGDRIRTVRITEDGRLSSDNRRTAARVANTLRR